ncbi:MAG: acylneuraminate cytidylyltransferase family protein [Fibrobacterota bacterium]
MKVLALIPARGGSKRVPSKNIRPLIGKPLIGYTIETALNAKSVTRVLVSTDSNEIARIARSFGADVPFMRPPELAGDTSTEYEFHAHALAWLQEHQQFTPDYIITLYPTSPLRTSASIDAALNKIVTYPDADSLRSIRKCSEHPYKMWTKRDELLTPFIPKEDSGSHTLSYQMLPEVFIQNASIYITKPGTLLKYHNTVGAKVVSFVMSEEESVDINSELDIIVAEKLLERKSPKETKCSA